MVLSFINGLFVNFSKTYANSVQKFAAAVTLRAAFVKDAKKCEYVYR